jgi:hypothetical protein
MSFRATTWIEQRGFLGSFAIYAGVLGALSLFLPLLYVYGKKVRQFTAGTVQNRDLISEKESMNSGA